MKLGLASRLVVLFAVAGTSANLHAQPYPTSGWETGSRPDYPSGGPGMPSHRLPYPASRIPGGAPVPGFPSDRHGGSSTGDIPYAGEAMDMLGGIYARGRPAPRERAVTSPQGAQGSYSASPSGRARGVGTAPGQSDTWNSAENRYYANKSACDADTQMRTRVGNSAEWTRYCANRFKGSNASAGVTQTPIAEAVAQPVPEARAAATDAYGSNGKSQADLADEAAYDARADNTWISDPVDSGGIQAREPVQATINAGQVAQWRAKESADLFLSPGDQSPVSRVSSGGCVTSTGSISGGMMQVKRADGGGVSQLFWTSISQYSLAPKWITEDICFTKVDDQSINITSNRIVP